MVDYVGSGKLFGLKVLSGLVMGSLLKSYRTVKANKSSRIRLQQGENVINQRPYMTVLQNIWNCGVS